MSRKHVLRVPLFQSSDASGTLTSKIVNVSETDKVSIHCKFSANVSGTFTLYAQNSQPGLNAVNDAYFAVPFSSAMTLSAESECLIVLNEVPFDNVYLEWVPDPAQTGTLNSYLLTKSVGA